MMTFLTSITFNFVFDLRCDFSPCKDKEVSHRWNCEGSTDKWGEGVKDNEVQFV
jgi:hypothetical protein